MATFEEQLKDSLSHAYEIERELGGGGMSRVFVATERSLGRKVVIKLLSPELTAEVNRGRFRREIQVAAQLQHPHIVTLLAAGEIGELVYYTMPFIEGESLKSALEKDGRLAVGDVIRILYDVVDALAYAHRHGVIHRDIKPGNILRSGSHSLVTDFGVAKALNAAMPSSAMTSTGMAIGTPAYMAPEQLAGEASADHRIDIYAVGLLAYELLSGQSPFASTSRQSVLAAVLTRDPKPLHEVRKDVPQKLSVIIGQCLSKIPGGRPPTAEALLVALDSIATASGEIRTREHKVPAAARTPAAAVPIPVPVEVPAEPQQLLAEPPRRSRMRLVMGALAVLVLTASGAVYMSQRGAQKSSVVSIQPPKAASAETAPTGLPTAAAVPANVVAPPPVITKVDSLAIAETVKKRLAQATAVAAATEKPGKAPINADSLRAAVQREISDSLARANAARAAALAALAPPVAPPVAPAAATEPAATSGRKRLAITDPKQSDQPALNSFSRALIDALRVSLDNGDDFALIDQDSVRDALARGGSRDGAAKILKPDVMVSPGYVQAGDAMNIIVTVWDLRSSSSYGIRVTSTRLDPAHPENYLGPIVQSVMKQLGDLQRTPTIYRR